MVAAVTTGMAFVPAAFSEPEARKQTSPETNAPPSTLAEGIAAAPDSPYKTAVILFQAGRYERALATLEGMTGETPEETAQTHNLRGVIYFQMKKWPEALASFEAALGTAPQMNHVRFNIGETWFVQQEYGKAEPYFSKLKDASKQARFKLVLCLLLSGQSEKVDAEFTGMEPSSKEPMFYYCQAARCYAANKFEEATYFITSAQGIFEADKRAYYEKAFQELGWKLPDRIY